MTLLTALRDRLAPRKIEFERLPLHVREAVRRHDDASERLIGWIQLGIVTLFGLLYVISPKTHLDTFWSSPVPLVLSVYLAFTLLRLAVAHRGALPDWVVLFSSIADIALLMALIWSFHIQYEQPAAFYLKAPTMLYVFIFIALRALRFDSRHVLFTGLAAAAGWLAMLTYAIFSSSPDAITRDYVAYLTSNLILVGAEFDKVISILVVTGLLALAQLRARSVFLRAVTEEAAHRNLSRFFPAVVADRITGAEHAIAPGEGESREASVLMVDIRGFSRLVQTMPPSAVMALLGEYRAHLLPIIGRHGGVVDKFMGDGIMITFGATAPSESFATRAVDCACEMAATVKDWNRERETAGAPPLPVAIGIATGPIVFGAVGDAERLEYTVIGDTVNRAAKLEKHCRHENVLVLCDQATMETARLQRGIGQRGPEAAGEIRTACMVHGLEAPVDLVVLTPEAQTN